MKDRPFSKIVVVEPRYGKPRYVRSLVEAGRILLKEWPREPGPKHKAAQKAILSALKGEKTPEKARRAFEAAAREAGILTVENIRAVVKEISVGPFSRSTFVKHPRVSESRRKEKPTPSEISNGKRRQQVSVGNYSPF